MKSLEFVRRIEDVLNYSTLYVSGCFGAPMSDKNKQRYCNNNDYNRRPDRQKMIRAASSSTFGFDCVNLIKGILWGWRGDPSLQYGGAEYASNGVPDINQEYMIKLCKNVSSTDWDKMTPGEVVWLPGHIGVYVGRGEVIECTPKWTNNVQRTALGNAPHAAGLNTRVWQKHGFLPYLDYSDQEEAEEEMTQEKFNEMFAIAMKQYNDDLAKKPISEYAAKDWAEAEELGIVAEDSGRPRSPSTREENVCYVMRALRLVK